MKLKMAAAVASVATLAAVYWSKPVANYAHDSSQAYPADFETFAKDVWRKAYIWYQFDVHTFLIKVAGDYVLVDAGVREAKYAQELLRALDTSVDGNLKLVVL